VTGSGCRALMCASVRSRVPAERQDGSTRLHALKSRKGSGGLLRSGRRSWRKLVAGGQSWGRGQVRFACGGCSQEDPTVPLGEHATGRFGVNALKGQGKPTRGAVQSSPAGRTTEQEHRVAAERHAGSARAKRALHSFGTLCKAPEPPQGQDNAASSGFDPVSPWLPQGSSPLQVSLTP
jgi:hypothetical protein